MIEGIRVSSQFLAFNLRHLSLTLLPRTVPGASVLALSLLAGVWCLSGPLAAPNGAETSAAVEAGVVASAPSAVAHPYGPMLVDLRSRLRSASAALARTVAPLAKPQPIAAAAVPSVPVAAPPALRLGRATFDNTPLPPPRPAELKPEAVLAAPVAPVAPTPVAPTAENLPPAPQLSLAAPENTLLPPRRPAELDASASPPPAPPPVRLSARETAPRRGRGRSVRTALAAPVGDNRTFLEKLFGAPQTSSPALGYAAAESGGVTTAARSIASASSPTQRYDRYTAIYDISAHTVYLPNGTRLEAHSGLGALLDNPHYVHQRMRGATPPSVYELTPREQLFHGVQALRLTPLGGNVFGRAGLLAHTYMLGPNGDSNGCVSFRNYQAFLQAYQNGEVRRLAVVASLN